MNFKNKKEKENINYLYLIIAKEIITRDRIIKIEHDRHPYSKNK